MRDRVWPNFRYEKIQYIVLAPAYSPLSSTIGTTRLNFRVRNENGCDPRVEAPKQNIQFIYFQFL